MRFLKCVSALAVMTVVLCAPALAHEQRAVGPVRLVVGWDSEPAYIGFPNGVQVTVRDAAGQPVTDVGNALKVVVSFGDRSSDELTLEAKFGQPGVYVAQLIPTRPGEYTFKLSGTVRGQVLDQTFTSSDSTFDSPAAVTHLQFPAQDPAASELAQRITQNEKRLDDARDAAEASRMLGLAGIVVGTLGLIVALVAVGKKPRAA